MIKTVLWIGAGSFAGGVARYFVAKAVQASSDSQFPIGTFIVNIVGCLLIGFLYGILDKNQMMDSNLQLFLIVGFCGGFTTFSTFINENVTMLNQSNFLHLAVYLRQLQRERQD